MRRQARLALAALGIAAIVYGAASLTGGWLGTPPWWMEPYPASDTGIHVGPLAEGAVMIHMEAGEAPRRYRKHISVAVIVAGLGLAMAALRPQRPLRVLLGTIGIAAALYGSASLTGGWLGTPSWWSERYITDERGNPPSHDDARFGRTRAWRRPRYGREWISATVVVSGLGLAAFALWPRKTREEVPSPPSQPTR